MDGEHIEMVVGGWSSTSLRKEALDELVRMREELAVLREQVADMKDLKVLSVSCPRCGLTFSEVL